MQMPDPDPAILSRKAEIVRRLQEVLPAEAVIHDPAEVRAYECDALTAYRCPPLAAVLPSSTEEVAAVLGICHAEGVPVVPRGAGTSLAGGSLPTADCVLLGVARLNRVLETDYDNRFIRVQTGKTNLSVTGAVEDEGFFYAPDPSSQLACAIAGNIAMNSGGAHCLKYGVTTNNLLGVTMVLMDGTVVEIGGAFLDAPGYDLLGLVCGSEGQLGVVTEATLRILAKPEGARPVLMGFGSSEVAGACVADIIRAGVLPVAIEFMDRPCIRACEDFAHAGYPDVEALLIVEVEGAEAEIDEQLGRIKEIAARHAPEVLRESGSAEESALIWKGRKAAFGAMGQIADYICLDGTIPVSELPFVLRRIGELTAGYGLGVANVFHAGDGNMHPLILYNANEPGELEKAEALGADILKLCVEVGGCLTGEHGVGVEKRDLMAVQYGPADLEAQLRVKDVFDPKWLLNPAKVFPLATTEARRRVA
jgi:glycolate oxidase